MKTRQVLFLIAVFLLVLAFTTCGSSPPSTTIASTSVTNALVTPVTNSAEGLSLLEAIEQSAERIATELPAGSRVAVLSFDTDSPKLSVFIMEELSGALFDRGIIIADRQNLDVIYRELAFQMSGDVSDSTVQSIGKFLSAEMVITGQMRPLGTTYRFTANAIHVETATRASIPRLTVRNDREIQNMIAALNQQTGATGATVALQSERAIAEAHVEEVRAVAEKITTESSTAPEAQAVAALAAEALAVAETRAEEARTAETRAAEARAAEEARRAEEAQKAATAAAVARIPVPTGLSAEAGYTTINLSWNVVTGVSSYNIYRSVTAAGTYTQIANQNSTNYTDKNLNQNTTFYYKISAVIDDLEGRQSTQVNARTMSLTAGTMVPGNSLTEKLAWLQRSAENHNTYILEVNANESITPQVIGFRGGINITVVLRGDNENRTIRLRTNGTMFTVNDNTFVLENNITLQGHNQNTGYLVSINGGIFRMNIGSTITGNNSSGVYITNGGTFEMNGGTISNNTSTSGGGVYMWGGTFTMSGGIISGNTATSRDSYRGGGAVYLDMWSIFAMSGGTISDNTALRGGGVRVKYGATFIMNGGTITNNIARDYGGGVFVDSTIGPIGEFAKTGGTITGYINNQSNANVVMDDAGNILARRGHAVSIDSGDRKRDATAGPEVHFSYSWSKKSGGWDN